MNMFWKTIVTTLVTVVAIVSARYFAQWVANKTFRADRIERSGKNFQIDENDLWICAQAKERDLIVVTGDGSIRHLA